MRDSVLARAVPAASGKFSEEQGEKFLPVIDWMHSKPSENFAQNAKILKFFGKISTTLFSKPNSTLPLFIPKFWIYHCLGCML